MQLKDQHPTLHHSTFEYLRPTDAQMQTMARVRLAAKVFSDTLERELPAGPDKTYAMRKHREVAMWANIAVTRQSDGAPREDVNGS